MPSTSQVYLRHISGVSQAYYRHLSGISKAYLRHISVISQAYLSHISQVSLWFIKGIYQVYLNPLSQQNIILIWLFITFIDTEIFAAYAGSCLFIYYASFGAVLSWFFCFHLCAAAPLLCDQWLSTMQDLLSPEWQMMVVAAVNHSSLLH